MDSIAEVRVAVRRGELKAIERLMMKTSNPLKEVDVVAGRLCTRALEKMTLAKSTLLFHSDRCYKVSRINQTYIM